ncbi:uncharacterized protein LOC122314103 [Carya illinoinensis]|uniref:uncharacterized protein LOC122314103 n=1 Tax=Carya illinoinensis TaxID=32201 RepID=UPI001C72623C|nr:uncharacterized protein LOC122314103 [Carya illinoinensis]
MLMLKKAYKEIQVFYAVRKEAKQICCWNPPPPSGFLKLNVDGAMLYDQQKAGVGVILRDDKGEVLVACSKLEKEMISSEFIEATAMLRGLHFCAQWGVSKLILESDCLVLVNDLLSESENFTELGVLMQDIRRMLNGFQEVKVSHVNRLGNEAVHRLAKHAWNVLDIEMWWDFKPSFVSQAIWLDEMNMV